LPSLPLSSSSSSSISAASLRACSRSVTAGTRTPPAACCRSIPPTSQR
jgi:hypothetical protein